MNFAEITSVIAYGSCPLYQIQSSEGVAALTAHKPVLFTAITCGNTPWLDQLASAWGTVRPG
jgi:hypothetical protein